MARLYHSTPEEKMHQSSTAEGLIHFCWISFNTESVHTLPNRVFYLIERKVQFWLLCFSLVFVKQLQSYKTSKEGPHPPCTCIFDPRQVQHSRQGGMGADFQVLPSVVSATSSCSFLISLIASIAVISS